MQSEQLREQEERARAAAAEKEAVRRLIKQLPRPTMAARTDTSVTLAMRRLTYGAVRTRWETPPSGNPPHLLDVIRQ